MASQTTKPAEKSAAPKKRGINDPFIYAGTIIVLVIVIIAFVFVPMGGGGSGSITNNGQSLNFGTYDGKPVEYSQGSYFAVQVNDINDRMRQQGLTQDNYQLYAYQVYRGAFERTVVHMAAIDSVKKAGGNVTEAWLDKQVAESAAFQENGKFSAQKYHDATLSQKLSVRSDIRDNSLYSTYISDLLSASPSSKETAFVKDMSKATRTIEYAAYPLSKYPDSEVEAWGEAHLDLFRSLTLSRVTITSNEADAKKLLKNIQDKKTTFEDVAKASSKDSFAAKGGLGGPKYYFELSSELAVKADADKLAALKVGELSTVLKTANGTWVFFRAESAPASADLTQGSALAAVRGYLTNRERGVIEDWAIAQAKELSASGANFASLAKKKGVAVKTAGPFPINYGNLSISIYGQNVPVFAAVPSEGELAEAPSSEKFLLSAFSTAPGAVAEPFVLGDNVLVLKVKEADAAKDEAMSSIDSFYPYFFQNGASAEIRDLVMKSPLLKDDFSASFTKYFQPAAKTSSSSSKG
jgi:peptidyl-prolyl cis-trans isomerase D